MPVLRIVKQYNKRSPLNGIVETDKLSFETKRNGLSWLKSITELNKLGKLDWDLIDYEWALITEGGGNEILKNPTGGYIGKLHKPGG